MSERAADLVVIGAGPAGSSLALGLARAGYDVVLCDQHRIPHDKLCGEFLSAEAVARLRELDLERSLVADFAPPTIDRLRLVVPGKRELTVPLAPPALGLSRLTLDHALARACTEAGVEVRDRWRATRLRAAGKEFVIDGVASAAGEERQHLRARIVAGAFGKEEDLTNASTDDARERHPLAFIAFKAHHREARGGDYLGDGEAPLPGAVELFIFDGGYCGVAPIEGGRINVCALATRASFRRAGATIEGLLAEAARLNTALGERLRGLDMVMPSFLAAGAIRLKRRRPVSDAFLRLGDAAAMIAPLCGDGIGMALSSSALSHEWIVRYLEGKIAHEAVLAGYARSWRRRFHPLLARGDALQKVLLDPRTAAWTVRACHAVPALGSWLARGTRNVPAVPV